jgi:hypothetical protein
MRFPSIGERHSLNHLRNGKTAGSQALHDLKPDELPRQLERPCLVAHRPLEAELAPVHAAVDLAVEERVPALEVLRLRSSMRNGVAIDGSKFQAVASKRAVVPLSRRSDRASTAQS